MKSLFFLLAVLVLSNCAHVPTKESLLQSGPTSWSTAVRDSGVEVGYLRGQNVHRCVASAQGGTFTLQSYLDQELLKKASIKEQDYRVLVGRVDDVLSQKNLESSMPLCRAPFKLMLRIGKDSRSARGCWSAPESRELRDLVQDLELALVDTEKRIPN